MTNNEFTAKMAEDSMSMVAIVLYNPLIPAGDPVAARTLLPCRMSRPTIMRVRITLSESEIEMYGIPGQMCLDAKIGYTDSIPIAVLPTLALSVTTVRAELNYAPIEPRNMRHGKAMNQKFKE